jgi:hypothetical protein
VSSGRAVREQNQSLNSLRGAILDNAAADVCLKKISDETQDLGSALIVVLGTPAVVALFNGIQRWIDKHGDRVVIETADGHVVATGSAAENINIAQTVSALGVRDANTGNIIGRQ